jgi:hypothetical protein
LPITGNTIALVRKIYRWQRDVLAADVVPYVKLCPVAYREHAYVLAFVNFTIVNIPKLGALAFRVPLAKFITYRKNAFLGAGFFLIAAGTTYTGIKLVFGNGIKQGSGLQGLRLAFLPFCYHFAFVNTILHMAY